jgi:hypothetical protein
MYLEFQNSQPPSIRSIFFIIVGIFFVNSCGKANDNYITIGNYTFDFPNDFKLIKEKGDDSYVGKIKGDNIIFEFDYGYYSNGLIQTPQEFLQEKFWLIDAASQFMEVDVTYSNNNFPVVNLLSVRQSKISDTGMFKNADFIATCKHETETFDYPITLPAAVKQHNVKIDTIQNHFRKIVLAKNPSRGMTGIYLKDLNGFNESINGYLALSLTTNHLTKEQQDTVTKIFSTVKFNKE